MHIRSLTLVVLALVVFGLSGCHVAESEISSEALVQGKLSDTLNSVLLQRWGRTCALCHINGQGGAPRLGNTEEWQLRLLQSDGEMLRHTIEGFNNMPPLGYCMSCSQGDFVKLIEFMSRVPQ